MENYVGEEVNFSFDIDKDENAVEEAEAEGEETGGEDAGDGTQ